MTTETAARLLESWRSGSTGDDPMVGPGEVAADAFQTIRQANIEGIPLEKLVSDEEELKQLQADADRHSDIL